MNAKPDLVSVLVRSTDRDFLLEALDSIALQTWPRVEVIVVAAVKDQTSVVLDRKVVNIDTPIRTTGAHQVSVALFDGITGVVNLSVVAQ
jgi:hypothetical protein